MWRSTPAVKLVDAGLEFLSVLPKDFEVVTLWYAHSPSLAEPLPTYCTPLCSFTLVSWTPAHVLHPIMFLVDTMAAQDFNFSKLFTCWHVHVCNWEWVCKTWYWFLCRLDLMDLLPKVWTRSVFPRCCHVRSLSWNNQAANYPSRRRANYETHQQLLCFFKLFHEKHEVGHLCTANSHFTAVVGGLQAFQAVAILWNGSLATTCDSPETQELSRLFLGQELLECGPVGQAAGESCAVVDCCQLTRQLFRNAFLVHTLLKESSQALLPPAVPLLSNLHFSIYLLERHIWVWALVLVVFVQIFCCQVCSCWQLSEWHVLVCTCLRGLHACLLALPPLSVCFAKTRQGGAKVGVWRLVELGRNAENEGEFPWRWPLEVMHVNNPVKCPVGKHPATFTDFSRLSNPWLQIAH